MMRFLHLNAATMVGLYMDASLFVTKLSKSTEKERVLISVSQPTNQDSAL
jgi:hypothetical protein